MRFSKLVSDHWRVGLGPSRSRANDSLLVGELGLQLFWGWFLPTGGQSQVLGVSGCRSLGFLGLVPGTLYIRLGPGPLEPRAKSRLPGLWWGVCPHSHPAPHQLQQLQRNPTDSVV